MTSKNVQRSQVYIEEGSDIEKFEEDINKALTKLCIDREIQKMEFKTGIQDGINGIDVNWYSMAMFHVPKKRCQIKNMLDRMDKIESEFRKYERKEFALEKRFNSMSERINKIEDEMKFKQSKGKKKD